MSIIPTLLSNVATFGDKLRTLKLAAKDIQRDAEAAGESPDDGLTSLQYLKKNEFSGRFIDSFFRPFYGGIFLDGTLGTSSRVLEFTLRMLATGEAAVPAKGMGEIPRQLASNIPEDVVELNSPVEELIWEDGCVPGVRVNGDEYEADAVVVATGAPETGRLTGERVPTDVVGQVCVYYATGGLNREKKILLNADDGGFLNNAIQISNVSPSYAPEGQELVCAAALDGMGSPDEELYRRGIEELSGWYPRADLRPLAVYRIPFAQYSQPPGAAKHLPANRTATPGLMLAGEYTQDSSINGAMLSGEMAARELLSQ